MRSPAAAGGVQRVPERVAHRQRLRLPAVARAGEAFRREFEELEGLPGVPVERLLARLDVQGPCSCEPEVMVDSPDLQTPGRGRGAQRRAGVVPLPPPELPVLRVRARGAEEVALEFQAPCKEPRVPVIRDLLRPRPLLRGLVRFVRLAVGEPPDKLRSPTVSVGDRGRSSPSALDAPDLPLA